MKRAILSCSGMDKPEGSLAREVAILAAAASGSEIICPVLLNRSPERYRKILEESALIIIDGCPTRCATKLAELLKAKVERRLPIADALKASSSSLEPALRLGPNGLALAQAITDQLIEDLNSSSTPLTEPAANWEVPAEFITIIHDKFMFRIPVADYLFNENDCWVRVLDGVARVGISDYMQQRLTDIGFFVPIEVGTSIEQFGVLGNVESAKAVFEIVSPVSGMVTAVNKVAVDNPEIINGDPYGKGWLLEINLSDFQQDQEFLLDGAAYAETVKRKAAEE